jgi:hypothetical protein
VPAISAAVTLPAYSIAPVRSQRASRGIPAAVAVIGRMAFVAGSGAGGFVSMQVFTLWMRGGRWHLCHTERAPQGFVGAIGAGGIVAMPVFTLCMRGSPQLLCQLPNARRKQRKSARARGPVRGRRQRSRHWAVGIVI